MALAREVLGGLDGEFKKKKKNPNLNFSNFPYNLCPRHPAIPPFTLKAIAFFPSKPETNQRFIQTVRSDTHLNNKQNVWAIHRRRQQTDKQNVHVIEHHLLCTTSLINTRQKSICCRISRWQSKVSSSAGRHRDFFFGGERKRRQANVATVNSKNRQPDVSIPFRNNTSRQRHSPPPGNDATSPPLLSVLL